MALFRFSKIQGLARDARSSPWGPLGPKSCVGIVRSFFRCLKVGSCVPGQTLELGKPELGHFEKTWIGIFSKYFENMCMCSNYFEKIPPAPPRPKEGVVFLSKYFERILRFTKYLKTCQSMFFSKWPIPGFPSFRVWPGTQDPSPWGPGYGPSGALGPPWALP